MCTCCLHAGLLGSGKQVGTKQAVEYVPGQGQTLALVFSAQRAVGALVLGQTTNAVVLSARCAFGAPLLGLVTSACLSITPFLCQHSHQRHASYHSNERPAF